MVLPLEAEWLDLVLDGTDLRPELPARGTARVRLDLNGRDVLLTGDFEARVVATCVACLDDVGITLSSPFTLHLEPLPPAVNAPGSARAPGDVELTRDELDVDYYTDHAIDLSHWLREQLLLEAPVHPRHEGDCPTALVSPPIAADGQRPVDPRLAPLLAFVRTSPKE